MASRTYEIDRGRELNIVGAGRGLFAAEKINVRVTSKFIYGTTS